MANELAIRNTDDVIELIDTASSHNALCDIVGMYLAQIHETENAYGEAYEETADRLDDNVMRAAARRWWEIEG